MLIPGMPCARASSVYKEIEFALACQPGEEAPAINGDGPWIITDTFLEGKVPPTWLRQIRSSLSYEPEGIGAGRVLSMISFLSWVARKVRAVDDEYVPGDIFIGRGKNARAIFHSLSAWTISQSQRQRSPGAPIVPVAATAATAATAAHPMAYMDTTAVKCGAGSRRKRKKRAHGLEARECARRADLGHSNGAHC